MLPVLLKIKDEIKNDQGYVCAEGTGIWIYKTREMSAPAKLIMGNPLLIAISELLKPTVEQSRYLNNGYVGDILVIVNGMVGYVDGRYVEKC
jgi:hypothetical protein